MMTKFFQKIFLLLLPLIFISPILFSLITSRELFLDGINQLKKCHLSPTPCLIGLRYTNPESTQLKLEMANHLNPEVLAVGTSRIMQVRSFFFNNPNQFYNAGGSIRRLGHVLPFLKKLKPSYKPKILLISLDQRFFNPNWDDYQDTKDYEDFSNNEYSNPKYLFSNIFPNLLDDLYKQNINLSDMINPFSYLKENKIGLAAHLEDSGFRNDGSYQYGNILNNPENPQLPDFEFKMSLFRIKNKNLGFQSSNLVSNKAIDELKNIFQYTSPHNIHVVALIPPYAHLVYQTMMNDNGNYSYMENIFKELDPIFKKFNYTLFDASDITWVGGNDKEMLDGFHGSEKAYLRILLKISMLDEKLRGRMTNLEELNQQLQNSKSNLLIQ